MSKSNNVVRLATAKRAPKVASKASSKPAAAPAIPELKGKRLAARNSVRQSAFTLGTSRKDTIKLIELACPAGSSEAEVRDVKREVLIGIVASKLQGKGDLLASAEQIVVFKGKPATPGCKAIRSYQTGRRTEREHKIVRAAEQMVSQLFAEIGRSNAMTQGEHTAKKRAAQASKENAAKGAAPTAAEIAERTTPMDQDGFVNHFQTQLAALIQFGKKHAKVCPTEFNVVIEGLGALKQVSNNAANEYQVRKAKG